MHAEFEVLTVVLLKISLLRCDPVSLDDQFLISKANFRVKQSLLLDCFTLAK
jgi:hypothetical protein